MIEAHIGRRVKALRESNGLSQVQLAEILNLNDRQSVSEIENGRRRLSAAELVKIVQRFETTLDSLTNPFLLSARDSFSWRQSHVPTCDLDKFESKAGEWIGAFRELSRLNDVRLRKLLPRLGLTHASSFEDAIDAGEGVADELGLTENPARHLADVMQSELGILVLMVDAIEGVSGAACRLSELNAVLINRNESEGRRNSDLSHELFHILTWNEMKPQRVESSLESWDLPKTGSQLRNQRIERLADNFGFGLLMPGWELDRLGKPQANANLAVWLVAAAKELGVSSRALKWRMANSRRLPAAAAVGNDELAAVAANILDADEPPLPFSRKFLETVVMAIEGGHLSGGRASELMGMSKTTIGDLAEAYGIERPAEL